jgi:bacterioferritin-associated ferredoxin
MYVCNCNGLTKKDVRKAIEDRPRDALSVYRYHGCEPQCGRCVPEIREMLEESRESEAA